MKLARLFGALLPLAVGAAAAAWTDLSFWTSMKEGLIAFLGFLAASLVQVMPLTTNFLQSDKLNPSEAERLTNSLTRQQYYWIGLLSSTIAAMVLVIVGAALESRVKEWPLLFQHRLFVNISWSSVVCFFVASSVCFVLAKMLGLFEGLMSLHRLRGELVINAAKRQAAEKAEAIVRAVELPASIVPADYGKVISPPVQAH